MMLRQGRWWHLRRRVPKRFEKVEDRKQISVALNTEDEAEANRKAVNVWDELLATWELRLQGKSDDAEARYQSALTIAASRGFRYQPAADVAEAPVDEIVRRIAEADQTPAEAPALLGAVPEPDITVSRALEIYWEVSQEDILGKSEDQIRRWRNPRIKAFKNFIEVIGDKPIAKITRDDMLDFKRWWVERIQTGDVGPNSANKDFTHLSGCLSRVNEQKRLRLDLPVGKLNLKEITKTERFPFSSDWIRTRLLARCALDGLNDDARHILLTMVNTGARPSEIAGLSENTIRLDDKVPHISFEPEGRHLKNEPYRRKIPLLGVSLEAMRAAPTGFDRYRASSATLSDTINKFLRENELLESENHTLYGLRHSFEDRMLAAGIDERIRRDVMGHALGGRQRYGKGASLEQTAALLAPVAF
ncbi:MAG: DUF6538 domain-containing protein [Pseudomonadota bacterium]